MSLSSGRLNIVLKAVHPVVARAAFELGRAWLECLGGSVRLGAHGTGPRVRIGLGSLVIPAAVVRFDVPYAHAQATTAERLALTIAAWDCLDNKEGWRLLARPLRRSLCVGNPDLKKPWAVTLGWPADRKIGPDHQLHVIGDLPFARRGEVWWPRRSAIVAAVLGRADRVLGDRDPLVYDAVRAGVSIYTGRGELVNQIELNGTLAGLVPATLTSDRQLWRHVAQVAADVHATGRGPDPLMTPEWVCRGRERMREYQAAPSGWEHLRRRSDKLRRDPRRFLADSKYAPLRAVGQVMRATR